MQGTGKHCPLPSDRHSLRVRTAATIAVSTNPRRREELRVAGWMEAPARIFTWARPTVALGLAQRSRPFSPPHSWRRVRATLAACHASSLPEVRPWRTHGRSPGRPPPARVHEQEHAGARGRWRSRAARLLGGAGLPWRTTAWRARDKFHGSGSFGEKRAQGAARKRSRSGAVRWEAGLSRLVRLERRSARGTPRECSWWCGT